MKATVAKYILLMYDRLSNPILESRAQGKVAAIAADRADSPEEPLALFPSP